MVAGMVAGAAVLCRRKWLVKGGARMIRRWLGLPVPLGGFWRVGGHAWAVHLPELEYLADRPMFPRISFVVVYEDGVPLPSPHTLQAEIREIGDGRFVHWGEHLRMINHDRWRSLGEMPGPACSLVLGLALLFSVACGPQGPGDAASPEPAKLEAHERLEAYTDDQRFIERVVRQEGPRELSVVLLVLDTTRADRVAVRRNGCGTTPRIEPVQRPIATADSRLLVYLGGLLMMAGCLRVTFGVLHVRGSRPQHLTPRGL